MRRTARRGKPMWNLGKENFGHILDSGKGQFICLLCLRLKDTLSIGSADLFSLQWQHFPMKSLIW